MDSTWVGACTITALFAWVGFNRPSWSRTYTTAARYRWAVAGHVSLYLLLLVVVYAVLRWGFAVYARVDASTTEQPPGALIWIAAALTLCVQAVPALSAHPRAWLQRMAGIPGHAQRLATLLADAEFEATASDREIARRMLLSRGVDGECDEFPLAQPAHRLLFKAAELFVQLRHWEDEPRFSRFVFEARNDFDLLRRRFDRLSFRVSRALALIERLGEVRHVYSQGAVASAVSDQLDGLLRKMAGDLIADSCQDIGAFYDNACLLAARGVVSTQSTGKGRDAMVARLGFVLKPRATRSVLRILAFAAVLVSFGMFVFFRVVPVKSDLGIKGLVSVVSLIVFGAIAIATVPKLRWGFANAGLHARTPVPFVVGAGVCAMLFAVAVNLGAGALLNGVPEGALKRLRYGSPYLPGLFVTAATIAWLVQDHRWRDTRSPWTRRFWDAAALGSVWLLTSIVGNLLRAPILSEPILPPLDLLRTAVSGLLFGSAIGYCIPESVRVAEMRSFYETALAPTDVTSPKERRAVS